MLFGIYYSPGFCLKTTSSSVKLEVYALVLQTNTKTNKIVGPRYKGRQRLLNQGSFEITRILADMYA